MKLATKLFLVVFWFLMGMFFFVMFSVHGVRQELPPVTAFLGMTVCGLGFLYIACYCAARVAKDFYRKILEDAGKYADSISSVASGCPDKNAEVFDLPEDNLAKEDAKPECEETEEQSLFSEEELDNL